MQANPSLTTPPSKVPGSRSAIALFGGTLFATAFLLFWLEPLVGKMLLPLLGGAPAVWNTATMFFQLTLLAGYGYAHLLARYAPLRLQIAIHAGLIMLAFAFLPFGVAGAAPPAEQSSPILWVLSRLTVTIGLPFLALSASTPLLQSWFARVPGMGRDPYFLYAASNLGSLVGLISFPLLLEPGLVLGDQSTAWRWVYGLFVIVVGLCGIMTVRNGTATPGHTEGEATSPPPSGVWRDRLVWTALAFVPSSLLLGVTTFVATDIASVPLLWVVPLALYLLSFVLTFATRPPLEMEWCLKGQAVGLILIVLLTFASQPAAEIPAHYLTFFLTALVCHGVLAARRPPASRLTEFYFCVSAGGALGGIFNALVAPVIFSAPYEYQIALVLACVLRGLAPAERPRINLKDFLYPLGILLVVIAAIGFWQEKSGLRSVAVVTALAASALAVYGFSDRGIRFGLGIAAMLLPLVLWRNDIGMIDQERDFFGVNRVKLADGGGMMVLEHGTTVHGGEFTDPSRWQIELGYYHQDGPAGQVFAALEKSGMRPHQVAVLGLGTGTLACYRLSGEAWTFYEIDPVVIEIARDPRYFHYLERCGADDLIVPGDARLSLAAAEGKRYDLMVLDAFSSDAVPVHLLTREALQIYLDRLAPDGLILMHISNRFLDLAPMLAESVDRLGLVERREIYTPTPEALAAHAAPSEWMIIARKAGDLEFLASSPAWETVPAAKRVPPWTDSFSDILDVLRY